MPTLTIPRLLLLSVLLLALTACADGTAVGAGGPADDDTASEAPIPVEPDGGIGDGAGAPGDSSAPIDDGPIPVEPDGGIGDGAGPPGPLAEPPSFGVSSETDSLSADPYASCWTTEDTGVCSDGAPTPMEYPLKADAQLVVTYEPGTVTAYAWPLDEADPAAEPADADRTELTVVEEHPGVNLIDVSTLEPGSYHLALSWAGEQGDAHTAVALAIER
ncbi:hypothetical protein DVS28_a0038 [Euzebya pacifica]|uniref:Uncharacterized protein n=1 Tax=Euzebya pacifica TaxID=1608957 RepID=A0A346XRA0_9ACTN|nr:hypothetical protein [Euzebya pacifica]AXV04747.1 hypothetical protein DVS28_a0038 [Euzebya pacifica]